MRHLILPFLVFSVNSFPQDLNGRFVDDLDLAYNSPNPDSSLFADPTSTDGSSDLFATANESKPIGTDNLGGLPPLDTLDGTGTSLSPLNPGVEVASWPDHPEYSDSWDCGEGLSLACCVTGACIWYNSRDPHCYYEIDLMCCKDIDAAEAGIDCGPATPKNQVGKVAPPGLSIIDILRWEVPTGWLAPLVGGSVWNGS